MDEQSVAAITEGADQKMQALYRNARTWGYDLKYDFNLNAFEYTYEYPKQRNQSAYISMRDPSGNFVRFTSPCLDLGKKAKKRLTSKDLRQLLVMHGDDSMHCRFAIDEDRNQLVLMTDQLFETMDKEEFRVQLKEVAEAADNFERSWDWIITDAVVQAFSKTQKPAAQSFEKDLLRSSTGSNMGLSRDES